MVHYVGRGVGMLVVIDDPGSTGYRMFITAIEVIDLLDIDGTEPPALTDRDPEGGGRSYEGGAGAGLPVAPAHVSLPIDFGHYGISAIRSEGFPTVMHNGVVVVFGTQIVLLTRLHLIELVPEFARDVLV